MGNSLVVQWLGLCAFTAGDMGLIPGRGTKILHATQRGQKIEIKKIHLESGQFAKLSLIAGCLCFSLKITSLGFSGCFSGYPW